MLVPHPIQSSTTNVNLSLGESFCSSEIFILGHEAKGCRFFLPFPVIVSMDYLQLVTAIDAATQSLLGRAAQAVNQALVLRNWLVGAHLIEFEQSGEDRARYGKQLLSNLAGDLRVKGLKGLGISMLKNCRQFYRIYPQIRQSLIGEFNQDPEALSPDQLLRLSWTHFIELIRTEDPLKRAFYEVECVRGNWSVRQLQRQIGSLLYERTGLSINKEAVVRRADKQEQSPPIAALLRDPYILEFAGLAERPSYSEADLETALLDHLQAFLLELGTGFCFEVDVIVLVTERNALLPGC